MMTTNLNSTMHLLVHAVDQPRPVHSEIRSEDGEVYASILDASVRFDPKDWIEACQDTRRVVLRCGDPVHADATGNDAARLLASWSQAGWTQFDEDLAALDQTMSDAGIELMIRPSSEGMLSDAICTMSWVRRSEHLRCSLLLDPIGWLVGSMMRDVDDHLRRIADLCQGCPKVGAVLIRSVRTDETGRLVETSIGDGEIDPKLIADRLGGVIRSTEAVVVVDWADLDLLGV